LIESGLCTIPSAAGITAAPPLFADPRENTGILPVNKSGCLQSPEEEKRFRAGDVAMNENRRNVAAAIGAWGSRFFAAPGAGSAQESFSHPADTHRDSLFGRKA